jgi:hypothetical protein
MEQVKLKVMLIYPLSRQPVHLPFPAFSTLQSDA